MDEAGRLITELQLKLAQLDHKVWLYRQDMATEFKKHADSLLRDVPENVSDTVNKAITESLKSYPSLHLDFQDIEQQRGAVEKDMLAHVPEAGMSIPTQAAALAAEPVADSDSTVDGVSDLHAREKEFQGLFTPSYLPLLDSTDRKERKSSSSSAASPAAVETKAIDFTPQATAPGDSSPDSSPYLSQSSLPRPKPPTPERRNTDEASIRSDSSDTPVRRSALRRSSGPHRPQSPRQVRFKFADEEYLPTSSPKVELPEMDYDISNTTMSVDGGDDPFNEPMSEVSYLDDEEESPPPKRISSSQALRALSRGPIEDDGTQWTEVIAPPDGSASIEKPEGYIEDSDDDESLSMPLNMTRALARANGLRGRYPEGVAAAAGTPNDMSADIPKTIQEDDVPEEKSEDEIAEEADILADMEPLQPMKTHKPFTSIPETFTSAQEPILSEKHVSKSPLSATEKPTKPWYKRSTSSDSTDLPKTTPNLSIEDDDDLFTFDENTNARSNQKPPSESESETDSELEDSDPVDVVTYATSPARQIPKRPSPSARNAPVPSNSKPSQDPPASHRASYHPFNTPIVSDTVLAQAASLGPVTSFVGSVKVGLEEEGLASLRGSVAGVGAMGSLRGGAPRSFSERMAFEDAMEAEELRRRRRGS
jgi:hypothetical protein